MSTAPWRPHITADPAVNAGKPTIAASGVPVAAVVSAYVAGTPVFDIYREFWIGRGDLLVCCWWAARYAKQRKAWRNWLERWERTLTAPAPGCDYEQVPLPPLSASGAKARTVGVCGG
ncbi:DUF433 domain-containing protein [Planomonospora algeriensis]